VLLTDKQVPGLTHATMVRFDSAHKAALIATPRGVVVADYSGRLHFKLQRSACPVTANVRRFIMAPDGSEIWCVQDEGGGHNRSAAVFRFRAGQWLEVPPAGSGREFKDVLFSPDGKRCWLSTYNRQSHRYELLQRSDTNLPWEPLHAKLPEYYGWAERFWLRPNGDELWVDSRPGLLRIKLASGAVSQYGSAENPREGIAERHDLVASYVNDLVFTPDGRYALCAATGGGEDGLSLIDLVSGKSRSFAEPRHLWKMELSADGNTAWCFVYDGRLWAFDVRKGNWSLKLNLPANTSFDTIDSLAVSADGKTIWARSKIEMIRYGVADEKWSKFEGENWWTHVHDPAPLALSGEGNTVICGHKNGIALLSMDGKLERVLQGRSAETFYNLTNILAIPRSQDFLCVLTAGTERYANAGELYRLDFKAGELHRLVELTGHVTAMAMGHDGLAWIALPGAVIRIHPETGQQEALPFARGARVEMVVLNQADKSDRIQMGVTAAKIAPPTSHPTTSGEKREKRVREPLSP